MRVSVAGSGKSKSLYIIKSIKVNGKNTTKIVEKLGNLETVSKLAYPEDPYEWAKKRAQHLTQQEKAKHQEVIIKYQTHKLIQKDVQTQFNGGYLFLQSIYYQLKLHKICDKISKKYKFNYDLNEILSRLIYDRILFPRSKKAMFEHCHIFIEPAHFKLHHVYRALEILAKETDMIQANLYQNSKKVIKRETQILYYDCTNYYFEIEAADDFRKYGKSKEHRPTPIVQMGLFMDASGLPLAFSMTPGNQNEQTTLMPLEQKIMKDFNEKSFIVCTDAGLSSFANRKFNHRGQRHFITTQSLKKLKKHLKEWALDENGWSLPNDPQSYSLADIHALNRPDLIFYKERWINENQLEQRLIVSYSTKYRDYQENIRQQQVDRALKLIKQGTNLTKSTNMNDVKRFIKQVDTSNKDGRSNHYHLELNEAQIMKEAQYDGFYSVCTNAEHLTISEIIKINHGRWEIEESFRIMKSEFKARPVNLSLQSRIEAHFLTCFISLLIFRILEKKISASFSYHHVLDTLRTMDFKSIRGEGMIPLYTRTDLTDELHEKFNFRTDFEIINSKSLKNILKQTKQ